MAKASVNRRLAAEVALLERLNTEFKNENDKFEAEHLLIHSDIDSMPGTVDAYIKASYMETELYMIDADYF